MSNKEQSQPAITNAVLDQKIGALTDAIKVGFEGVHQRQDTTNGKVLKSQADIATIQTQMAVNNAVGKMRGIYEKVLWFAITTLITVITYFLTKGR